MASHYFNRSFCASGPKIGWKLGGIWPLITINFSAEFGIMQRHESCSNGNGWMSRYHFSAAGLLTDNCFSVVTSSVRRWNDHYHPAFNAGSSVPRRTSKIIDFHANKGPTSHGAYICHPPAHSCHQSSPPLSRSARVSSRSEARGSAVC